MIQRDYLIVGGGVGGACACDALRQYDPKGSLTLVSNEAYIPYQRPPLSKSFLRDSNTSIEKLVEKTEDWYRKKGVELRLGTLVRELNIERRLAVLENGQPLSFARPASLPEVALAVHKWPEQIWEMSFTSEVI